MSFAWRKLGLVLDLSKTRLPERFVSHAQSPQVLQFEDFVRVYFSTRTVDPTNGKFLSHVCYVDVTKDFREVVGVSAHEVLPLGQLGAFDEHGIFPINVLRDGEEVLGYTTGWNRRSSVSVDTAVGLVVSKDQGATFQRLGSGPVLGPSLHEPFLVGDAFVRKFDNAFHMWYIFGTSWKRRAPDAPPDRVYKIGYTKSEDGKRWLPCGGQRLIKDVLGEDECQALPSVVFHDGRYHMFFCFREAFDFRATLGRGYRLGYAHSQDLVTWERDDAKAPPMGVAGEWDSEMQCYPHAFVHDGKLMVMYNGNKFGVGGFGLAVAE